MEEMKRFATETLFGDFCRILAYKDAHGRQGGEDLYPSGLLLAVNQFYPEFVSASVRGAAGAEVPIMEPVNIDHWGSGLLLKEVGQAKIDFPNTARKYLEILVRAESIWTALRNRSLVWV